MPIRLSLLAACGSILCSLCASSDRVRVIVDTDIGDDIDDSWAIALLLANPKYDVRLLVTDSYSTRRRAEVLARFLTKAGWTLPIAIAQGPEDKPLVVDSWAGPQDLANYRGKVLTDAAGAIVAEIAAAAAVNETVNIVVISPCGAVAAALERAPWIADHSSIFAMGGSLRHGDNATGLPYAEYNIKSDVASWRALYAASWRLVDAPLDTAGAAQIAGQSYQRLRACSSPLVSALLEMYEYWLPRCPWPSPLHGPVGRADAMKRSSVIYDALAVTLMDDWEPKRFLSFEVLPVNITQDGHTVIDGKHGQRIVAATQWQNVSFWEAEVVTALCSANTRTRVLV